MSTGGQATSATYRDTDALQSGVRAATVERDSCRSKTTLGPRSDMLTDAGLRTHEDDDSCLLL